MNFILRWTRLLYFGGRTSSYVGHVFCTSEDALRLMLDTSFCTSVDALHVSSCYVGHVLCQVPGQTQVDVAKCHAYHTNGTPMSPSAAPATQSAAASRATSGEQARHQSQPSATSATPATQMERRCHQVSHLPRKCRAKCKMAYGNATPATPNEGGCRQVPRLPRETKVDVAKRHTCHAKCRSVTGD